jgi:hypothetical protein
MARQLMPQAFMFLAFLPAVGLLVKDGSAVEEGRENKDSTITETFLLLLFSLADQGASRKGLPNKAKRQRNATQQQPKSSTCVCTILFLFTAFLPGIVHTLDCTGNICQTIIQCEIQAARYVSHDYESR